MSKLHRLIQQFTPLNQIAPRYHGHLAEKLSLRNVRSGQLILRKAHDPAISHFLVSGEVEVRESFDHRYRLHSDDPRCKQALEKGIDRRAVVRAQTDCEILSINNDFIDQLLSWEQDFTVFFLDEGELALSDHDLIDDSFAEDWDNRFIQSALATNLSNLTIHRLLSSLEDIEVVQDQWIIHKNSPADYFYVIKQGQAEVVTSEDSVYRGQQFELVAGDYFGDEALVASTLRNASVRMKSDGVLGRINAELFGQLIRDFLVSPADRELMTQKNLQILDVRMPFEYQTKHYRDSKNIPISHLRQQIPAMPTDRVYLVTPENDCRSELATYLLRQAGLDAYHLPGTIS